MDDQIKINFVLPHTWSDLNEEQLHYILQLRSASSMSPFEIRVACLMRFTGMEERRPHTDAERELAAKDKVHFMRTKHGGKSTELILPTWFLTRAHDQLAWLDHPTRDVTRLCRIVRHFSPVSAKLDDIRFGDYLTIENYWQSAMAWAATGDSEGPSSQVMQLLHNIAVMLYKPSALRKIFSKKPFAMSPLMTANILHWLTGWHLFAMEQWPHLFRPSGGESKGVVTPELLREQVDIQLSALTGGDVTKLEAVLNVSAWDALNMLDIKQREADQMRKKQEEAERRKNRK